MKQTRSLYEFSCLSEYTRLYPIHEVEMMILGAIIKLKGGTSYMRY